MVGKHRGKNCRLGLDSDSDLHLSSDLGSADHVSRLPEHILCSIFALLDHPMFLHRCAPVCKLWNKLITNDVELKQVWAKQEPWLLVRRSKSKYEVWCPKSGVRFPIPAKLIPEAISNQDELGLLRLAGTHQGLTLSQSEQGLFGWAPLSGFTQFIPYPITPCPPRAHRRYSSEFWVDAEQAVFKIGHHTPDGVHLYDSSAGGWVFEETASEIRELGRMPVDSIGNDSWPFPAPVSFIKQYFSDCKQQEGGCKWRDWDNTPRIVAAWYAVLRDGEGGCIGVSLIWETISVFMLVIWRLDERTGEWFRLKEKSLYSEVGLCHPKSSPREIQTARSDNLVVIGLGGDGTPYPARIYVLNLDTLELDELYSEINQDDDSIHVLAFFKPTLPPQYSKFKSTN